MGARLQHIPTNLITGLHGAGKTSAILGLLARRPKGEHWAVLVNNFSAAGADPGVFSAIDSKDVSVSRVVGGCICCSAKVSLRVALMRLLRQARPQRLLIEAVGPAHAEIVIGMLRDPWLAEVLDLRAVICIADPRQFADQSSALSEIYLEQLALADIIIANKADLASPAQLEALLNHARALHPPQLRALPARNAEFPLEWLDLEPAPRGLMAAQKASTLTSAA